MESTSLWSLGLGQPYPVSALHGRGSGDLLDAVLDAMPEAPAEVFDGPRGPRRVALVGRPNVGKSSLLNKLAREERAVVDSVAGTTVDPVDSLVQIGGETWQLVDTRACASGSTTPAVRSTTRRCAPPAPSRPPRSPSCCSTPASRSASRTSAC